MMVHLTTQKVSPFQHFEEILISKAIKISLILPAPIFLGREMKIWICILLAIVGSSSVEESAEKGPKECQGLKAFNVQGRVENSRYFLISIFTMDFVQKSRSNIYFWRKFKF